MVTKYQKRKNKTWERKTHRFCFPPRCGYFHFCFCLLSFQPHERIMQYSLSPQFVFFTEWNCEEKSPHAGPAVNICRLGALRWPEWRLNVLVSWFGTQNLNRSGKHKPNYDNTPHFLWWYCIIVSIRNFLHSMPHHLLYHYTVRLHNKFLSDYCRSLFCPSADANKLSEFIQGLPSQIIIFEHAFMWN